MANNKTNYLEDEIVDHILGTGAWTTPTNVFMALTNTGPTETSTTLSGEELASSNGYARIDVNFGASSGGVASNTGTITFTASGDAWVAINGHAITDNGTHNTGNTLYFEGSVSGPTLADGDSYEFGVGDITVTET